MSSLLGNQVSSNVIKNGLPDARVAGGLFSVSNGLGKGSTGWEGDTYTTENSDEWKIIRGLNGKSLVPPGMMERRTHEHPAMSEFMTRFGLHAVVKRNFNLLHTLTDPESTIIHLNREYYLLAAEMAGMYNNYYRELVEQGMPTTDATSKADEYIKPILVSRMQILAMKYPYNFGSTAATADSEMAKIMFSRPTAGAAHLLLCQA